MTASPLRAIVVIPAHDEQERIGACLAALADQRDVDPRSFEIFLVLDHCHDDTRGRALASVCGAGAPAVTILDSLIPGVGHARRAGMDAACQRLLDAGVPDGLVATTDADTRVTPDWLAVQLELAAGGARAIGGRIELDPDEAALLPPTVLAARQEQARERLSSLQATVAGRSDQLVLCEHHQFSGASLAVTAWTYREVGGLPDVAALEDEALQRLLEERQIPIVRSQSVRVVTSARTKGRAPRGLARDLGQADWRARRTFQCQRLRSERAAGAQTDLDHRDPPGARGRRDDRHDRRAARAAPRARSDRPRSRRRRRLSRRNRRARRRSRRRGAAGRSTCWASTGPRAARVTRCGAH